MRHNFSSAIMLSMNGMVFHTKYSTWMLYVHSMESEMLWTYIGQEWRWKIIEIDCSSSQKYKYKLQDQICDTATNIRCNVLVTLVPMVTPYLLLITYLCLFAFLWTVDVHGSSRRMTHSPGLRFALFFYYHGRPTEHQPTRQASYVGQVRPNKRTGP